MADSKFDFIYSCSCPIDNLTINWNESTGDKISGWIFNKWSYTILVSEDKMTSKIKPKLNFFSPLNKLIWWSTFLFDT